MDGTHIACNVLRPRTAPPITSHAEHVVAALFTKKSTRSKPATVATVSLAQQLCQANIGIRKARVFTSHAQVAFGFNVHFQLGARIADEKYTFHIEAY